MHPGEEYFGVTIPECDPTKARMDVRQGVNFFQHLGPMKSRHLQIFNVDPKIDILPTWLLNQVLYSTMKSNIQGLQKFGPQMHDPNFKHFPVMEERKELYDYVMDDLTSGGAMSIKELREKYPGNSLKKGKDRNYD